MENSVVKRIGALVSRIEKKRTNYYPADWDADPLYEVVCELKEIIAGSQAKSEAASLPRVGVSGK